MGDSISIGYTTPLRNALKGKANLHRIRDNGGATTNGLANLKGWLGKSKWDLIIVNFGLHDLRMVGETGHTVSLPDYEKNLEQIFSELKQTGAKLLWVSTTPIPAGKLTPPRKSEDVPQYNAVAKKVMEKNGVPICDLNSYAAANVSKWQVANNVHYRLEGSELLGQYVAQAALVVLQGKPVK